MDLPCVSAQVVDERAITESSGLAEENSDRGAVGDRFGIELL
jgi:hypothetical protein